MNNQFKMRKNKAFKNLVSYGKYAAASGAILLSLGLSSGASADETAPTVEEGPTTEEATIDQSEQSSEVPVKEVNPELRSSAVGEEGFGVEPSSLSSEESTPTQVDPTNVVVSINGLGSDKNPVADGSTIIDGATLTYSVEMTLPDKDIKAGDYINVELPETLRTTPTPQTIAILDNSGNKVGELVLQVNRQADGTYINTTGILTFTNAFSGTIENKLAFDFNISNSSYWKSGEMTDITLDVNGQTYDTGVDLKVYVSTAVNFGTSTRLWQVDDNQSADLYTLYHQSEVAIVNPDEATSTTVVYTLDPDTLPYARYDVATIREQGWNIRMGTSRNNRTSVNTLNNDQGITFEVSDDGTKVTLHMPNFPAGFGINGGSIPVLLTEKAISEKYSIYYNSTMDVYVNPVGTSFDESQDPTRTVHGKNSYQFTGASASSTTLNNVIVQYVDENDNQLATRSVTEYRVGENYTSEAKEIPGYTLTAVPSNATGTVTAGNPIFVKYVYTLDPQKITYTVIDDTDNTTLEEDVELVTGGSNTTVPDTTTATLDEIVKAYVAKGYTVVSRDDLPATFDADKSVDQNVVIHLIQIVSESTETKTVTRTIQYVYEDGSEASAPVEETVTFTRTVTKNEATGETTYGEWSEDQEYKSVTSPTIANYTADRTEVAAAPVSATDEDSVEKVVYTANIETKTETKETTLTVRYHGAGDQTPEDRIETVTWSRTVKVNAVTGEVVEETPWTSEKDTYETVVSPEIANYSVDKAEVANEAVTEEDKVVDVYYTANTSETTETKTITRVIKYVDKDGNEVAPSVTQTVTYKRKVTTNDATGEQTFEDWTTEDAEFKAVTSPTVANHTADRSEVPSAITTPDSTDSEEVVVYTKNPVEKPTPKDQTPPSTPDQPEVPANDVKDSEASTSNKKAILPNTGDTGSILSLLGMSMLGFIGLAGKRKED